MFSTILAVFFFVQGVRSQCCPPKQWEGVEEVFTGVDVNGTGRAYTLTQRLSYDAPGKRLAVQITDEKKQVTTVIQLYGESKEYVIHNGVCQQKSLAKPYNESCIPVGAKLVNSSYIGFPPNTIQVNTFTYTRDRQPITAVIGPNCTPVEAHITTATGGVQKIESIMFHDLTIGIKNPSVFVPPPICNHSKLPHHLGRKRRMLYPVL